MSTNLVVADKAHATLGASSSDRWMSCPGSVALSRGIPNVESEFMREGTAAHALAELCLRKGVEPATFVGMTLEGVEVTDEMTEFVSVFVDYCRRQSAGSGEIIPLHWIEHKFSLAQLNPPAPMFGTADFVVFDPKTGELEVIDLKYGRGVLVEVKGNRQLRYYGLGAALSLGRDYGIKTVKLTIVQPRAAHPDGVVRSETVDFLELVGFAGDLLDAARATLRDDAPLAAGDHCKFCPARAVCPEQRRLVQALAQVDFDVMPLDRPPLPETLTVQQIAAMLPNIDILESWAKGVRAHAQALLERGEHVPGYKLVAKRATRKWASEAQVRQWLESKSYAPEEIEDRSLKSPAQIEKVMGKQKKELPTEFVTKESSGWTLALEHDPRPAVSVTAGSEFDALPASTD